jgi:transposase-like protein
LTIPQFFTPEQKAAIIRRHLLENVPVSDLCEEYGIHATQYYNWQKQLFENAAPAFERRMNQANQRRHEDAAARKISQLEAKLQTKNEVIAELMQENVRAKKKPMGNFERDLGSPSCPRRSGGLRTALD